MSSAELTEWMAYFTMEPFGQQHDDYRAGVICSVLAKTLGNSDAGPARFFRLYDYEQAEKDKRSNPFAQIETMKRLASEQRLQGSNS